MTTLPPIANVPWTDPTELGMSAFGVALVPDVVSPPLAAIECRSGVRGLGISVTSDGRIRGAESWQCYVGARLGSSDSRITDTDLWDHRDACLWIAKDAGNCRSLGNHFYGSRIAIYNEGGEGYQSTADRAEDSFLGALCNAKSKFFGTFLQQNLVRDLALRGGNCEVNGCDVRIQLETKEHDIFNAPGTPFYEPSLPTYYGKAGAQLDGGGAIIDGGIYELTNWIHPANTPSGKAATAIIVNAPDCTIRTKIIDSDGLDGSIGIYVTKNATNCKVVCDVIGFAGPTDHMIIAQDGVVGLDATFHTFTKHGSTANRVTVNGRTA